MGHTTLIVRKCGADTDYIDGILRSIEETASADTYMDRAMDASDFVNHYRTMSQLEKTYDVLARQLGTTEQLYLTYEDVVPRSPEKRYGDFILTRLLRIYCVLVRNTLRLQLREMRVAMLDSYQAEPSLADKTHVTVVKVTDDLSDIRHRARGTAITAGLFSSIKKAVSKKLSSAKNAIKKVTSGKIATKVKNAVKSVAKIVTAPARALANTKIGKTAVSNIKKAATNVTAKVKKIAKSNVISKVTNVVKKLAVPGVVAAGLLAGKPAAASTAQSKSLQAEAEDKDKPGLLKRMADGLFNYSKTHDNPLSRAIGSLHEIGSDKSTSFWSKAQGGLLTGYQMFADTWDHVPVLGKARRLLTEDFLGFPSPEEFKENPAKGWGKTAAATIWTATFFLGPGAVAKTLQLGSKATKALKLATWLGLPAGAAGAGVAGEMKLYSDYDKGIANGTATRPDCSKQGFMDGFLPEITVGAVATCERKQEIYDETYKMYEDAGALPSQQSNNLPTQPQNSGTTANTYNPPITTYTTPRTTSNYSYTPSSSYSYNPTPSPYYTDDYYSDDYADDYTTQEPPTYGSDSGDVQTPPTTTTPPVPTYREGNMAPAGFAAPTILRVQTPTQSTSGYSRFAPLTPTSNNDFYYGWK